MPRTSSDPKPSSRTIHFFSHQAVHRAKSGGTSCIVNAGTSNSKSASRSNPTATGNDDLVQRVMTPDERPLHSPRTSSSSGPSHAFLLALEPAPAVAQTAALQGRNHDRACSWIPTGCPARPSAPPGFNNLSRRIEDIRMRLLGSQPHTNAIRSPLHSCVSGPPASDSNRARMRERSTVADRALQDRDKRTKKRRFPSRQTAPSVRASSAYQT